MAIQLVIQAVLMAHWQEQDKAAALLHSDRVSHLQAMNVNASRQTTSSQIARVPSVAVMTMRMPRIYRPNHKGKSKSSAINGKERSQD